MSEFKATKGKWEIHIDEFDNYNIISNGHYLGEARNIQDALLISKAPEMLEMLKEFEIMCDKLQFPTETTLREMRNKARQLIKEATEL